MHEKNNIPNLEISGMPLGKHETQWDLVKWLYVGGAGTRLNRVYESIKSGMLGEVISERIILITSIRDCINLKIESGSAFASVRSYLQRMNIFIKWVDDCGHLLSMDTAIDLYTRWTDALLHRLRVERSIMGSTAKSLGSGVGQILDSIFEESFRLFDQTRLVSAVDTRKKGCGLKTDKQNLEITFHFGHLLQDICDGLTIDVLWGQLPARISLRDGRELHRYSGLMPLEDWRDKQHSKRAVFEEEGTLRTRSSLANLRTSAELLMFIGQTGMNLAQAHRLELRHFCYASDVDGYKVKDYKKRRGGEVLFEIYREYRGHFERYLEWRRSVFPDEVRLFPLARRKAHEDRVPSFWSIKKACAEVGIKWVSPRTLRNTRVNWLLRRSGDADLTAEMAQHSKQTLFRNYEDPSQQVAIAEITRFWSKADPHLTTNTPHASIVAGACNGKPEVVSFKPQSAPSPDCLHPSGCLWCAHHRDIDSFDYIWALTSFRHLKTVEVARYCPPTGEKSEHPADHAIKRISKKLAWFRDSNAVRNDWVAESMARLDEGSYHPDWALLINEVEGEGYESADH
ncbi:site-specific integrase (plasmid) [Ralstonia sp. 25C]|uniref:site-specific integrase n=1 Tax=Ralstonia sp. 25C TaxID=3447363 RepID=UPI003F751ED5